MRLAVHVARMGQLRNS